MTIAEIAQRAGVSKAAVSRYLNNGYISSEKREAIRRVIEETGYIPSQQAQTLRTGKSRMIGVIVPRIDSEAVSRVVAGISRIFEEQGYRLLLANTENRMDKELEYLEVFRTGNVDGVLLVATILSPAHRKAVQACSVPVVLLGQQMDGVTCVYHDDRGAAYAVTRLMLQGGRKKLGYIGVTQRDRAAGESRRAGFWMRSMKQGWKKRRPAWNRAISLLTELRRSGAHVAARKRCGRDFLCNRFHSDWRNEPARAVWTACAGGCCAGRHWPFEARRIDPSAAHDRALLLPDQR